MAVSLVGSGAAAATTVAIPTHQVGDLIVIFAYRDGSTTPPTVPSGGFGANVFVSEGGGTNAIAASYKFAESTGETSGTWTNATGLVVHVYRGAAIGDFATNAGNSSTIGYPSLTDMHRTDNTSYAALFAGHRTATNLTTNTPSGYTAAGGVATEARGAVSNSTVSSVSTASQSVNASSNWRSLTLELKELPKTETIFDDFNDNSIDTAEKWYTFGSVSETGGVAQLSLTGASPNYHGYYSQRLFDLRGSYILARLADAGNQAWTSIEVELQAILNGSSQNRVFIIVANGTLIAYRTIAGTNSQRATIAYNSTTMRWLRIRESGGTTYWEYTSDAGWEAGTWTTLHSETNPISLIGVQVEFDAGNWQAETGTTTVQWDNLNIAEPYTYQVLKNLKYTVLTDVAITKSLGYKVAAEVGITKGLSYHILAEQAPIQKSLKYTLQTEQTAITKSLSYRIQTEQTAITKSLGYKVIPSTEISKSLQYVVVTEQAPIQKSLQYTVQSEKTAITKSLKYTLQTEQTPITKSLQYMVAAEMSAISKSLKYTVVTDSVITKSLAYHIVDPNAIQKGLTYRVITEASALTKSLKYTVVAETTAITKSLRYAIQPETTIQKGLIYSVISEQTPITKSLSYEVVSEQAPLTKSLKYTIVIEQTAITKSLGYTVITERTPVTKSLTYEILTDIAITKGLIYKVLTDSLIEKSLQYHVTTGDRVEKSITYRVLTDTSITKSLRYTIVTESSPVQKSLTYHISTENIINKGLIYKVLTDIGITKALIYKVIDENLINKSLRYDIVTGDSIVKGLEYQVVVETNITKSVKYTVETTKRITKQLIYRVGLRPPTYTIKLTLDIPTNSFEIDTQNSFILEAQNNEIELSAQDEALVLKAESNNVIINIRKSN